MQDTISLVYEGTDILDLHKACRLGELTAIKKAYYANPTKLNQKDQKLGWTPLYRTIICGHFPASQYLLSKGADPNFANNLGESPLHQAADNSQYELAELLLSYGADPNLQQDDGDTPLHHAAFRGDVQMLSTLLKYSADPNKENYMFGRTPTHYAADCDSLEAMELLLSFRADLHKKDRKNRAPIDSMKDPEMLYRMGECQKTTLYRGDALLHFDNKVAVEPDAETLLPYTEELKPIYRWLDSISLHELYEFLVLQGIETPEMLAARLKPKGNVLEELRRIGITKIGQRYKILIRLEEASFNVRRKVGRRVSADLRDQSFWNCCVAPSNYTVAISVNPSIAEWLRQIGLEEVCCNFIENGFADVETMVLVMNSRYPITDEILLRDVKITDPEHRKVIMGKLIKDSLSREQHQINVEETGKKVSCELCIIC